MIEMLNATCKGRLVMTQISALDNQSVVRIASAGTFLPTSGRAIVAGANSLLAIIKEKEAAAIKYGLLGTLSIVSTYASMWLVGISMNYSFNL
jgi:hypothetical protein